MRFSVESCYTKDYENLRPTDDQWTNAMATLQLLERKLGRLDKIVEVVKLHWEPFFPGSKEVTAIFDVIVVTDQKHTVSKADRCVNHPAHDSLQILIPDIVAEVKNKVRMYLDSLHRTARNWHHMLSV